MISIIVPVYNVEKYLSKCLDSLVRQTYRDIEIICVNDGSTDNSQEILEKYAATDERVVIVCQENQGLSGARNTGIDAARGEWIMFVDSDDWIDFHCCETVIRQTDLCFFSYIREYAHRSYPQYIFGDNIIHYEGEAVRKLYSRLIAPTESELHNPEKIDCLSTAWGKLYKTSIIKEHNLKFRSTQEIGTEDLLFNVYYFTWVKDAVYLPNAFYHYKKDNVTSLTKLYKPYLREQWELLFTYIEQWIEPLQRKDLVMALVHRRALCLIGEGLNITFAPIGFLEQRRAIYSILNSDEYKKSIRQLPMKYFPIHWRLFFEFARFRSATGVLFLLKLIKIIIQR